MNIYNYECTSIKMILFVLGFSDLLSSNRLYALGAGIQLPFLSFCEAKQPTFSLFAFRLFLHATGGERDFREMVNRCQGAAFRLSPGLEGFGMG